MAAPLPIHLPTPDSVASIFTMLLGRATQVKKADAPMLPDEKIPSVVAAYVTDEGAPVAAFICDMQLACLAGAALTMVPPGPAKEAAARWTLPDNLKENYREIVNILAQIFNHVNRPHVVLGSMEVAKAPWPEPVGSRLQTAKRADFEVTISSYGAGKATVLTF